MKILLLLFGFLSALTVLAATKPVSVAEETKTTSIQAEVVNIAPNTKIDITAPFSQTEKTAAKSAFNLNEKEAEMVEKINAGEAIAINDVQTYAAGLLKVTTKRSRSPQENALLFTSGKKAKDVGTYLYRKELKELGI